MGFIGQDTIVFIRKDGHHYHLPTCQMINSLPTIYNSYYGIEFKDLDKRLYHPCTCINDKIRNK